MIVYARLLRIRSRVNLCCICYLTVLVLFTSFFHIFPHKEALAYSHSNSLREALLGHY